ncbi:MAG: sugar nucleotide-binding protein [Candidatus Spechtbacteria bacterium]|nr:sugar nucleotide-binding protein [Candidatus Spechtbacteria bacterium]
MSDSECVCYDDETMKVLILGAKGMLGTDLSKVFADEQPYLLDKEELDITQREEISACFFRLKPDVVINAAAYTDVDGCETNKELAMKVNGEAPGYLAAAAKDAGAIFVHYSTDYVFDGKKSEGYSEKDEPASPKLPLRPRSEASQRGEEQRG